MSMRAPLALVLALSISACLTSVGPAVSGRVEVAPDVGAGVRLLYMGTGGWLMGRGDDVVMTAPLFSNPGLLRAGLLGVRADTLAVNEQMARYRDGWDLEAISLVEALISAMRDKFGTSRIKTILGFGVIGAAGSVVFALPQVVNAGLEDDGVLGLTLVDLIDHWAFQYGLVFVGLIECLVIGWGIGTDRLLGFLNERSRVRLGPLFALLIKFVIPGLIFAVLALNVAWLELDKNWFGVDGVKVDGMPGVYGASYADNYTAGGGIMKHLHWIALGVWIFGTFGVSMLLTGLRGKTEAAS